MARHSIFASCFGLLAACGISAQANAVTERVLHSFPANSYPYGRLDTDSNGSLYGTAYDLGGSGAIFRLKQRNGAWSYKTIFGFGGSRGANPYAGVTIDHTTGILYGVTRFGSTYGDGVAYSLAPYGRGWIENVLHSFSGGSDGAEPSALLLKDKSTGNLFGTAEYGGTYGCGTVFELSQSGGGWSYSTLYDFTGQYGDGCTPWAQLRPGARAGTLIGTTVSGSGKIFQLKEQRGAWRESIVYSFTGGSDGGYPYDLDAGSTGTIYGVAYNGGAYGHGVVFQLTPIRRKWSYSVIYAFRGGRNGSGPVGINLDSGTGILYGTTQSGGRYNQGTLFELFGCCNSWTHTVLHDFAGGADGAQPQSRPIYYKTTGTLYGTTLYGGIYNGGTVYSVQP